MILVTSCYADVPCPLKLIDGSIHQEGVGLTFRNTGKLPIQELALDCTPMDGRKAKRTVCRTETGLFYPGQQYDLDFQYSSGHRAVLLTLESARLSDGSVWRHGPHQSCKSLKVVRSR
jgi:hypothetical protein